MISSHILLSFSFLIFFPTISSFRLKLLEGLSINIVRRTRHSHNPVSTFGFFLALAYSKSSTTLNTSFRTILTSRSVTCVE